MEVSVLDELKRRRISELLEQGKRADGRALDEPRRLSIDTGVVPKANGSARVRLGDTDVVCGVKVQPDRPFPDTGDRGTLICTAEVLPLAHHTAEPGPPHESVIELARVVDRGIRESGMVDMRSLVIERDVSVVGVFADNSVTDADGNLFDACSYAAASALLTAKMPRWEMEGGSPRKAEGPESPVPVKTIPVSVTMARIGDHILVDPDGDEWEAMDARVTITTNSEGSICAMQKGGRGGLDAEQLVRCGETSARVGAAVRDQIRRATGRGDL